MKLSILIATFDRSQSLKKTLESIAGSSPIGLHEFQVVVVDNNSRDNTKAVVEDFINKKVFDIRYILEEKQGKVFALNTGLRAAQGDVIVFTDDDVVVSREWLKIIAEDVSEKKFDCVTGRIVPVIPNVLPVWYSDKISTVVGNVDPGNNLDRTDYITGSNMAIRKYILEEAGGFKYRDGLINEDTILSRKISGLGYKMYYDPRMIVFHYFQQEKFKKPYFKKWYFLSGRAIALMNASDESGQKRNFFNIPLWRYREGSVHLLKIFLYLFDQKNSFFHQLNFLRFMGYCYQRWFGRVKGFEL
jgi:glycosyltransferase involved in cell wall biosynthesis